jgi:hypothetical protein
MIVTTAEPVRAETSITLAGPSESKLSRMLTISPSSGRRTDRSRTPSTKGGSTRAGVDGCALGKDGQYKVKLLGLLTNSEILVLSLPCQGP